MSAAVVYREYRPEDREGVRDLLVRSFGDSVGFDRYEHGNPLGAPLRVVAEMDGAIVGFNLWNAWRIPTESEPILAYQSGASAVAPETRGQGVFGKLLREGERVARDHGVPLFVGFPNQASFGSFLRAGWTHIGSLPLRVVLRPALGRRGPAATSESPRGETGFHDWRYRCAGAGRVEVEAPGGAPRVVYFREDRVFGLPALRLLDVLGPDGTRVLDDLPYLAARLPGPRAVFLRTSEHRPLQSAWIRTVARSWATPVIVKGITGEHAPEEVLKGAPYMYGDIDAA